MFTKQFFDLLLNLDDNWQVSEVEADYLKEEVHIHIKHTGKLGEDPESKELRPIYDHAPKRQWRHLDTLQYKTFICCKLPRIKNKEGKIRTIIPPWASKHERHTYLFERMAIDILQATKNQTKTAEILKCGFNVINRIIHTSTERGLSRRNIQAGVFNHLSIDEKAFKRGHQYVSVLSSPHSGCVIDLVEGRTKESVTKLFNHTLSEEQQRQVKTMSMDMWKAFISVTREKMPNAEIVHDRFHLVKYLNEAIDKVRRREVKTQEDLKNSRYALLKNKVNLTEKQRLKFEAITAANYEVSKAWRVRENFKDLFCSKESHKEVLTMFVKWATDSMNRKIKEVDKVVNMFTNHIQGVVNALKMNFSNAMAERLNGKLQEVKLSGRGYRTFKNFRSAILFFHGGLNLYPLK